MLLELLIIYVFGMIYMGLYAYAIREGKHIMACIINLILWTIVFVMIMGIVTHRF